MAKTTILVVDDESAQREILAGYLKEKKHTVLIAASVEEALGIFKKNIVDIVLTDYKMPGLTGFDLLKEIKSIHSGTTVVLMTAFGTIEGAVDAIREGAYDYLNKPIELDELDLLIERIQERNRLISENRLLKEQLAERYSFQGIISQSAEMEAVLNTAARVAESRASVMIRGESGTGKELIARAIHFSSPRKEKPFLAVSCAALNDNLLESELFGHEKGAFTGADRQRKGRFELADGGTLFLDEIGDIPSSTQVKLLRVLQEQKFERLGGTETLSVDVRIIAATNKNLEEAIAGKSFREDLFYRLNVVTMEIPPLRSRRSDIAPLLDFYLRRFAKENKRKKLGFSKEALDILFRYDYPGNIRELENIIQRAVIMSRGEYIVTEDLPQLLRNPIKEMSLTGANASLSFTAQVEKLEKDLVFEALRVNDNNQSSAAKQLGISERNLRYRLKKWGIK